MEPVVGVVFDLDDTLYLERTYVASGFRAVARAVSSQMAVSEDALYEQLMELYRVGNRGRVFDAMLERYPLVRSRYSVEELVRVYREHVPQIEMLPGMEGLLRTLKQRRACIGLLSDGWAVAQRRKVQALRLESVFDMIVLTDEWGRAFWKPHPRGYETIESAWGLEGPALLYVADNPEKDFVTANTRGWRTVRLRVPGQLHFEEEARDPSFGPAVEVRSVAELAEVLLN